MYIVSFRFVWFWVFQCVTSLGIPRKEFISTGQWSRWKMAIEIIFSKNYVTINFAQEPHIFVPKINNQVLNRCSTGTGPTIHLALSTCNWFQFQFHKTIPSAIHILQYIEMEPDHRRFVLNQWPLLFSFSNEMTTTVDMKVLPFEPTNKKYNTQRWNRKWCIFFSWQHPIGSFWTEKQWKKYTCHFSNASINEEKTLKKKRI